MLTEQKHYGIKTIRINSLEVHTVYIRFNIYWKELKCMMPTELQEKILKSGLTVFTTSTSICIRETTTDYELHRLCVEVVGKLMKEVAQTKLNIKYGWVS